MLRSCQSNKTVSVEFPDGSYKGEIDKMGQRKEMDFTFGMMGQHTKEVLVRTKDTAPELSGGANVETYEGDYLEDERTGKGKYIWPDNSFMKERFYGEQGIVFGIFVSSDQTRYEGYWFNDKQHGQGKLILPDGSATIGFWENGENGLIQHPFRPKHQNLRS